jgi:3-isopropylmalate/(R)-2-methylmalate dehydratase large subunit
VGQTITEKILAAHSPDGTARPGQVVNAAIDLIVAHEVTTPPAIDMLRKVGITKVWDASKIVVTPDHFVPNKDIQSAELAKALLKWVEEQGIPHYYGLGRHGICHVLASEQGHILPGTTVICGDSHTTTHGAFGCFAAGVGSTDLAAALATGKLWFKVPESLRFEVTGEFARGVYAKDLVLHVISRIGVDGANYCAMEWTGPALRTMTMESRMTLTNMAIEAGGKSGIIEPDEVTFEFVRARTQATFTIYRSDPDAEYKQRHHIDLSALEPVVAFPHLPSNTRWIGEARGVKMDQVYIGSCTNAKIEDLRIAASILKGNKVARNLKVIVVPATTDIYKRALKEGLLEIFADAGCVVSTATCGACLGGSMGVLGAGEKCLSTTNRNFVGRMGSPKSEVYLASPATAAATAIEGVIADPREYLPR